jgi:signal peptidase I
MGKTMAFFGATGALVCQPFRPLVFVGESMAPTYRSGEIAITVPTNGKFQRGDVVIIDMPDGPIVKRVAHLPGEEIIQVRLDDEWSDLTEVTEPLPEKIDGRRYRKYRISEGELYVLGDNRPVSLDSRDFGPVSMDLVTRKIMTPRVAARR